MIDIFKKEDMKKLMQNKSVVLMGDSNIRALYKDFLYLLQQSKFIPDSILKQKMEKCCLGDKLVFHLEKTNGRDYREEREAKIGSTSLSFFFLTRVYNDYVAEVLKIIGKKGEPDILIMNCCLWDVTRWGPSGVEEYKKRLKTLMRELKKRFPNCLVIWITAPPIATEMKGGFLLKELQFLQYSLRFHIMEANQYARKIVVENGFDVLDSHYHLKMQIHRRKGDGIHWFPEAVRYVTNLLLTHISLAWDKPLPHRYKSEIMEQNLEAVMDDGMKIEVLCDEETKTLKSEPDISSATQQTSIKTNKENHDTSKSKKRKKKRKATTPNPVPAKDRNTHHAFLSRIEKNQRRKRIKQWQNQNTGSYLFESPLTSPQHGVYAAQHDSGYISSPNQFQCYSNTSPNLGYLSNPDHFQCFSSTSSFSSYVSSPNLLTNPGFTLYSTPTHGNQYSYFPRRYVYPSVQPNYQLQPHIDFTSYNGSGIFYF